MSAGVDTEVMLKLPVKCWGRGGSESERKREFDDITWSNYRFKGEKDLHVVNSDIPRSLANKIKYFLHSSDVVQGVGRKNEMQR